MPYPKTWKTYAYSACIVADDARDGSEIRAAEEVQVVEQMVQIVQVAPLRIARCQWCRLLIRIVERWLKSAEELRHRDVEFAIADRRGRIDQHSLAVRAEHDIAAPEIAMQQGRIRGFLQIRLEMIQQIARPAAVFRREVLLRELQARQEALRPEELHPAVMDPVLLPD